MADDLQAIRDDLARHARLFDLEEGGLGDAALDRAVNGVKDHFDNQVDPDGHRWDELQPAYERAKARKYPGKPIGVREGLMRGEIDGERDVKSGSAEWTYGNGPEAREEASWFQEGDAAQNRPERRFADLNAESIGRSDQLFDEHFEKGTG